MESLHAIGDFILKNKEWLFSGIGITALAGIFFLIRHFVRERRRKVASKKFKENFADNFRQDFAERVKVAKEVAEEVLGEKLKVVRQSQEREAELSKTKKELDDLRREVAERDRIRSVISAGNPLNVWVNRTIKGNPDYILSISRKELEILVKNTFHEENSRAFMKNAINLGVVNDRLELTPRGYNTLIHYAKHLSTNAGKSQKDESGSNQ